MKSLRFTFMFPLMFGIGCSGGGSNPAASTPPVGSSVTASTPAPGATSSGAPSPGSTPTQPGSLPGTPGPVPSSTVAGGTPTPTGGGSAPPSGASPVPTRSDEPTARPSGSPSTKPTSPATAQPTAAPTAAPTGSSQSGAATYEGCQIFPAGDWYNADVTNAPIDANSASYIASLSATDPGNFYASLGIEQVNLATSSTPKYTIQPKVSYHSFSAQEPWSSGFYVEPGGGDAHSIVLAVTPPACHLYELYETTFAGNVLSAYSGANYDLSRPFTILPANTPSAMASGLSLFAGMVKYEELATGIHHALNISASANSLCKCFVPPASDSDGLTYTGPATSFEMPYGAHLRLKASFDDSGFGPQSQAIAEAMKHYGVFIADTSSGSNAIYTANPLPGTAGAWNSSDLSALGALKISDFDVLTVGASSPQDRKK